MDNIPFEIKAKEILKSYNGTNDYILELKNYLLTKNRLSITKNMGDYIINNYKVKPMLINKKFYLHKSCRTFLKEQYDLREIPEFIFINKLLTRKKESLHIWGTFKDDLNFHSIYLNKNNIKETKNIELPSFEKYKRQPKPHQLPAIKALLENDKFILADDMGVGKSLIINTLCYTPKGKIEIGLLKVGDKVIGSDGKPYNVRGVFPQGVKDLYKVTFNDGYSIKCCGEHLWMVSSNNSGENSKNRDNRYVTLSVNQMLDKELILEQKGVGKNNNKNYKYSTYYKVKNGDSKWQIPIVKPIEFYNKDILSIDPYLLGLCLGDGHFEKKHVKFKVHKEDYDELFNNFNLTEHKSIDDNHRIGYLNLGENIKNLNLNSTLSHTNFIPDIYKYSSIENRLAILQGLMDTDGHCMKSKNGEFAGTEYATVSEQLADDVAEIVHSLGGIVRKSSKIGSYKKQDGTKVICKRCYRLNIKMPEGINPFRLKRKAIEYNSPKKYPVGRYIKNIEPCGSGEAVCISVDSPDKLYVTEHAIITHNTTSSILAALISGSEKILIICTATLKLNWKKEIEIFESPNNISIVEGSDFVCKKWTIINYDILKNFHFLPEKDKETPQSIIDFYKFDLVIADECHSIKNASSLRTKIFNDFVFNIKKRWLLTGTPITNKPIDLYNLLYICESPLGDNWVHFIKRYCGGKQFYRKGSSQKYWVANGATNLNELNEYIDDIFLRRLKKDAIDLPDKHIKKIYIKLSESERYNSYIEEYKKWVLEQKEKEIDLKPSEHLTHLSKVRQLLSEDKVKHTIKLAEDYIENGHKVIIFSCFTNTINEIHEHFGKSSVLLDGTMSSKNKDISVTKFQNDKKINVFCGNIVAAGSGITLTAGTIVIFNDLDHTPANHAQASDRAYRMGQENDVHIIYMLVDNTLDDVMYDKLQEKIKNISIVLGDDVKFDNVSVIKSVVEFLNS